MNAKNEKKIAFMHKKYGVGEGKCKDCCNFQRWEIGNTRVRKCKLYGVSHSEATDWLASFDACGRFNVQPVGEGNMYRVKFSEETRKRLAEDATRQLPGQMEMEI